MNNTNLTEARASQRMLLLGQEVLILPVQLTSIPCVCV